MTSKKYIKHFLKVIYLHNTKSNIYRELPKKGGFDNLHGVWQKNGEEGVERIDFGSIFPAV